jgi:hypothetical protein
MAIPVGGRTSDGAGVGSAPEASSPALPGRAVAVTWLVERAQQLRPVHVGLLGSAMALAIVLARLLVPADGDISRFVNAGDAYVDPATVDPEIYVMDDSYGYDGQFFWRLAVDPLEWEGEKRHGVHFDNAYRPPRIVYPVLAWLAAGGQPGLVAYTLVGVNVVAYGVVAWLGALLAQRGRKTALEGLVMASIPGLVFALSRDLAEVVTVAALLAGVLALQRARPGWAAAAWCVAVVSREQAMLVVVGYGLWRLAELVRGRARPGRDDLPWLVPPLVFGAWQGVLWLSIGDLPLADSSTNLAWPFTVLVPTIGGWFQGDLGAWDSVVPAQMALAVVLVVLAVTRGRSLLRPEDRWLLPSLAVVVTFAVSLGKPVWIGPADLRQVIDVFTLSWVILLLTPRRLPPWLVAATGAVWLATAAIRSYAI